MKLVSLDIETLSSKTRALVLEASAISVEVEHYKDVDYKALWAALNPSREKTNTGWPNFLKGKITRVFPFYQQLKLGREVDSQTLKFHTKTPEQQEALHYMMTESMDDGCASVEDCLDSIRLFCVQADQIWINGLSFDPSILRSLNEQVGKGSEDPLWDFRAERDVRSFWRTFQLDPDVSDIPAHFSISDCVRNFATVQDLGLKMSLTGLPRTEDKEYGGIELRTYYPKFPATGKSGGPV